MNGEPIARYTFRRSVLEPARTYSLYDDRIEITGDGGFSIVHLLSDVRAVRLKYEHSKQREYYQCFIKTTRGPISLRHVSWKSFGSFEDRRATYTPFIKAVLAQLAPFPNVQFRAGSLANFIGAIVGMPLMAGMGWLAFSLGRTASATLAMFMLALCVLMIGRSRPRRVDPLAPPEDVLPD